MDDSSIAYHDEGLANDHPSPQTAEPKIQRESEEVAQGQLNEPVAYNVYDNDLALDGQCLDDSLEVSLPEIWEHSCNEQGYYSLARFLNSLVVGETREDLFCEYVDGYHDQ